MIKGVKYDNHKCHVLHPHSFYVGCKFQLKLSINDQSTHNNEQSGGCLIKTKPILNLLQSF